jgi:hypothetical protein
MPTHSICSACQLRRRLRIDTNRAAPDSALFASRGRFRIHNQGPGKRLSRGRHGSAPIAGVSRFMRAGVSPWPIILLFLLACTVGRAPAQVMPSLRFGPQIAVFGTYNTLKPDRNFYGDLAVYGLSLGGYLQTPHVIGVEVRGSINRGGGKEHQETALAGPRAALHFGRFTPYVEILGGEANSWRFANPPSKSAPKPRLVEELGPSWQAIGGVDFHVRHHLSIRLGEVSYGRTYLKDWTLRPYTASAGIVYRIH